MLVLQHVSVDAAPVFDVPRDDWWTAPPAVPSLELDFSIALARHSEVVGGRWVVPEVSASIDVSESQAVAEIEESRSETAFMEHAPDLPGRADVLPHDHSDGSLKTLKAPMEHAPDLPERAKVLPHDHGVGSFKTLKAPTTAVVKTPSQLAKLSVEVDAHLNTGDVEVAANRVNVVKASHEDSQRLAKLEARIALRGGNVARAVTLLTRSLPEIDRDSEHYGLLAAALLRLERYREAADVYGALAVTEAGNARWWVGYGLALERLGDPGTARFAFGNVVKLEGDAGRFRDLALTRLEALG